jgi:hypothetical protein
MSWENDETAGLIEAALLTEEKIILDAILKWFEARWEEAEEVDSRLLKRIRPRWRDRRGGRLPRPTQGRTILSVFDNNPEWFKERPLRLIGYEFGKVDDSEIRDLNKNQSKSYSPEDWEHYDDVFPFFWADGDWDIAPGEYVIEYDVRKSGSVSCSGIWRVRHENWSVPRGTKNRLILADRVDRAFGLTFPPKEQKKLGQRLKVYFKKLGKKEDKHGDFIDIPLDRLGEKMSRKAKA